jgi:hypothetical protein
MPTPTQLLSVLANRGTCSAEDLCRELGCGVGDVLRMIHAPGCDEAGTTGLWWDVEQVHIPGTKGWTYRIRQCVHERAWACRVEGSSKVW